VAKAAPNLTHHETPTTIVSVEYTPENLVQVTFKTGEGLQHLTVTATALVTLVNMATAAINGHLGQFIRDVSSPPLAAE
jgi:hypothetical protein